MQVYISILKKRLSPASIKSDFSQALKSISLSDFEKKYYSDKADKYSNACGCNWGASFLMVSIVIYLFKIWIGYKTSNVLINAFQGFLFIFFSAFLGKIIGITIARIKLIMLYYSLLKKQSNYVDLYKMEK